MANATGGNSFDVSTKSDGLIEKLVTINRHSQTTAGGRSQSFAAVVVVGDGQSRVGLGIASSKEVPVAIQKGLEKARRNMVHIELNGNTLYHEIYIKDGATKLFMKPASEGTGIIAGGGMRAVFEVLGVKNVLAKTIGASNSINVVKATIKALAQMHSPEAIAEKRGKTVSEIID